MPAAAARLRERAGNLDRSSVAVLAAMALGLVLRVIWVSYAARQPVGLYDPARYLGYAEQIAKGHGYVEPLTGQATAYYPPGYPYFLGAVTWVSRLVGLDSHVPQVAGYVQALLGTLTIGAAAVVARRLVSPLAAVVAAFVLALYPNLIFHTGALLSETLYNALFVGALAILCWRPWRDGLSTRRLVAFSVVLALAILTRPISVAFLPLLLLVWWRDVRSIKVAAKRFAVVVGVLAVFVLPWTVRNQLRMHAFVPMSTNTGDNLCIGHHPHATGVFDAFDPRTAKFCNTGEGVQNGSRSEVKNDDIKVNRSLDYLWGHLSDEPYLIGQRAYYMFEHDHDGLYAVQSYQDPDPNNWHIGKDAQKLLIDLADWYYAVVAIAGAIGLVVLVIGFRADRLLLVAAAIATVTVPLAFFGDARFKVPVEPLLVIAAGCLVGIVAGSARRRPAPEEVP